MSRTCPMTVWREGVQTTCGVPTDYGYCEPHTTAIRRAFHALPDPAAVSDPCPTCNGEGRVPPRGFALDVELRQRAR